MVHLIIYYHPWTLKTYLSEDALNKAKLLGYAESNPKYDLNGDDASSKVKILFPYVLILKLIILYM